MPSITSTRKPPQMQKQCRGFRFAFADSKRRDISSKRTAAVAEYVQAWLSASIVAERRLGSECLVTVALPRPVPSAVAERFCRECPHYIRDTFAPMAAEARPLRNQD